MNKIKIDLKSFFLGAALIIAYNITKLPESVIKEAIRGARGFWGLQ